MTVLLKIKTQGNTQTIEVAKNVANQAVKIQHVGGNAVYELLDLDTNVAPQQIVSKRVGNDLHIIFQDSQDEDLIIADYYNDPALIQGLAENGQYYPYIPANSEATSAIAALNDSMLATEVLGGDAIFTGWAPHWGLAAAGAAAMAAIAVAAGGSGGGSSSTPSTPASKKITDDVDPTDLLDEKTNTDTRIVVQDDKNLTPEDKAAVLDALSKNLENQMKPDVMGALGNEDVPPQWTDKGLVITYADGSTDTIPLDQLIKELITTDLDPTDPVATPVENKEQLTEAEKAAVKKAVEDANKGIADKIKSVVVADDGTVTVTYTDDSTDEISPDKTVKDFITKGVDPTDLYQEEDGENPAVDTRVPVDSTTAPSDDEKAAVIEALKANAENAAKPDVIAALENTTNPPKWEGDELIITYTDGSTDKIDLDQLVKLKITKSVDPTDLWENEVDTRVEAVYPQDWSKVNKEETQRVVAALKARSENEDKQDVIDALDNKENPPKWTPDGLLITYLDGSTDTIPLDQLLKEYEPVVPELRDLNTGAVLVYLPEKMVTVVVEYTDEKTGEPKTLTFTNVNDGTWVSSEPSIVDLSAGDYATIYATAVQDGSEVKAHSENSVGTKSDYSRIIQAAPNQEFFDPFTSESTGAVDEVYADYKLDTLLKYKATWEANGVTVTIEDTSGTASDDTWLPGKRLKVENGEKDSQYVITGDMISSSTSDNVNIQIGSVQTNNAVIVHGDISGAPNSAVDTGLIDFTNGFTQAGGTGYTVRTGVRFMEGADLLWVGASNPNVDLYFNPATGYSFTQTEGATLVTPSVPAASKETTGGSMRYAEVVFDNGAGDNDAGGDDTLVVEGTSDKTLAQDPTNAAIYNSLISLGAGNDTILTGSGTGETDYSGMILNSKIVVADVYNETYFDNDANEGAGGTYAFRGDNTIITTGLKDSVVEFGMAYNSGDDSYSGLDSESTTIVNDDTISIEYGTDNGEFSSTGNQINMGHGVDTLIFTGTNQTYVLADISTTPMSVETVRIAGDNNKVTVALSDLLDTGGNVNVDVEIGQEGRAIFRIANEGTDNEVTLDEAFVNTGREEVSKNNGTYDIYSVTGYDNLFIYVDQTLTIA
ncbi:hypothetical protein [Lonepinella sp. BR2271]|uniref:hypothetical protein n=1 Tax=Lonepinella sp. BR2271 TaxID=3434550 RepID=UPI003F6E081A